VINLYLLEYALNSILREKLKSLFIVTVFTLLVFLLSSVFFITSSIKYELDSTLDALPEIIVQNQQASRTIDIDTNVADKILNIAGVSNATPRVWGYYYFKNEDVYFTLVGIDEFEKPYKKSLQNAIKLFDSKHTDAMLVGNGVFKMLKKHYYKEYLNFIKPDGSLKKIYIDGVFDTKTALESNDIIVMSNENVRDIFGIDETKATDIVVKIPNKNEINTIAYKIKTLYPNARVITKEDIKVSYQNIFDYKSGLFLALFVVSIFTFFIIIYDKTSGATSEQKREVGILKALGWRVDDVLKEKFYEGFILSFFSYMLGVMLSAFYVYILKAPFLRDIFIGYSNLKPPFELVFIFNFQSLFIVFLLSVPIYIFATIIPSWKIATKDADEVMR